MRMIERGEHLRFTTEAREAIGIARDAGQQNLDRNQAIQPGVAGPVDLAHPARADPRVDLIRADAQALETLRGDGVFDLNLQRASRGSSWRARSMPGAIPPPRAGPRCRRRPRPGTRGVVPPAPPARPRTRPSGAANRRQGVPRAGFYSPGTEDGPDSVLQPLTTYPRFISASRTRSRRSPWISTPPSTTVPPAPQARFNSWLSSFRNSAFCGRS